MFICCNVYLLYDYDWWWVSFQGDWKLSNKADPNGLVAGHAYTITEVRKVL